MVRLLGVLIMVIAMSVLAVACDKAPITLSVNPNFIQGEITEGAILRLPVERFSNAENFFDGGTVGLSVPIADVVGTVTFRRETVERNLEKARLAEARNLISVSGLTRGITLIAPVTGDFTWARAEHGPHAFSFRFRNDDGSYVYLNMELLEQFDMLLGQDPYPVDQVPFMSGDSLPISAGTAVARLSSDQNRSHPLQMNLNVLLLHPTDFDANGLPTKGSFQESDINWLVTSQNQLVSIKR